MKEFVEKLIGMLEEEKQRLRNLKNDCVALSDHEVIAIEEGAYNFCKNIVNQLAEEYINTSTDTSTECNEALDSLHKKILNDPKMCEIVTEEEIMALVEAKNNGWIPCSERLPEYSDCYNVTVGVSNEMGYYECVKAFNYVKKQGEEGKWVVPKDLFSTYSVIAWQNTPAPYKEGE